MNRLRIVVLISGGGTTLKNLVTTIRSGGLAAEVVRVISSNPNSRGLKFAAEHGIPAQVIERQGDVSVETYSDALFAACRHEPVDVVVMAGFLKLVQIPADFENRVMNIHPSLIPAFCGQGFYGKRVHAAVLAYGAKISGCTVHFVDNVYDHGPVIVQRAVPVMEGDTSETLAERVFAAECEAYPEALALYAAGRLRVVDRVVKVLPAQ